MKYLFIFNEGLNEKSYNGLRLANSLSRIENAVVKVYFFGDGVLCAKQDSETNLKSTQSLIENILKQNCEISTCGSCLDARIISVSQLISGVKRGTLDEVADWTCWSDKTLIF
tara:strand:- start:187050 stop:187388 length:339 start_codon:yes stop_codon:yes gene_type:complete